MPEIACPPLGEPCRNKPTEVRQLMVDLCRRGVARFPQDLTLLLFLPKDAFSLHLVQHTSETFHLFLHVCARLMSPSNKREQLAQYAACLQAHLRVLIPLFFNTSPRVTPSWYFLFVHRGLEGRVDNHGTVVVCCRHVSKICRTNCCHKTAATCNRIQWCAVNIGLNLPQLE